MLNPWLSLSLNTAQLALRLMRIMTGVVPNSTESSRIIESEDRADPQVRDATEVQAPVPEVQERPMRTAAAALACSKATRRSAVKKK
jgi:hypothetical protein